MLLNVKGKKCSAISLNFTLFALSAVGGGKMRQNVEIQK